MVPLVFNDDGFLHSPESFNALSDSLIAVQRAGGSFEEPETVFTDLETFKDVLAGDQTLEDLYAAGKRGSVLVRAPDDSNEPQFAEVYDPYVNPNLTPPPCEWETFGDCGEGGGGSGGGGGEPPPSRPLYNVSPDYGTTPDWPEMWQGDVISGKVEGGFGGFLGEGGGHSAIVTRLDNSSVVGGNFMDYGTWSMEAVGKKANNNDEVQERATRIYWIDDADARDVYVRYHPSASWYERSNAIAYARAQNDDGYNAFAPKWWRYSWYCSKLVWAAYGEATGDDLDPNWGYWVFPEDLEASGHLRTVYRFFYNG